ncbi:MAG: fused PTS system fructose/mannitol-specific transporter subunit IIA/HTH DNA-binding domain-containing protein [Phycisphaerae bacterium]
MNLLVRDAARMLSVSERTVYRWIDQGVLPVYRVNEQYRFNRAELLEWATSRRMNVSVELFQEPDSGAAQPVGLVEALRRGGIYYRVEGADKPSVLRSVVDLLHLPQEVDREFLYQVLLARETLGSTGIGDGIAIPHVRNPIVLHISEPTVALCFLEHPIEFGALDGRPVHTLFTLISPSVRTHLHMLSRLSFILRDPGVKRALEAQGRREEILAEMRRIEESLPGAAEPAEPVAHTTEPASTEH